MSCRLLGRKVRMLELHVVGQLPEGSVTARADAGADAPMSFSALFFEQVVGFAQIFDLVITLRHLLEQPVAFARVFGDFVCLIGEVLRMPVTAREGDL